MIELLIVIFVLAVTMEIIDSGLGMMYGTLLSPLLIIMGYDVLLVLPSILISQAIGGMGGTVLHHRYNNANFKGMTHHSKIVVAIVGSGIIAVIIGALFASVIPDIILKSYIGLLVVAMGVLCLLHFRYKFKWWKIGVIGFISSFNKSATGGGFGPLSCAGKIISGVESKVSVATTTFAEVPICIIGFATYVIVKGVPDLVFMSVLIIGAFIGGVIGPYVCAKMNTKWLKKAVGILAIVSGIWILWKLFF